MEAVTAQQTGDCHGGDGSILVTQVDFYRLSKLVKSLHGNSGIDPVYLKFLNLELQKAEKVDSKQITPDFVTMNSLVRIKFPDTGTSMDIRLVYPQNADLSRGLVSVLSPLGCALLGYRVGDVVTFQAPKNIQKVRIDQVLYQPEANGEDLE